MNDAKGHLNQEQRLLTVEQVSVFLNLHPQTIYVMAKLGQLPVLKIGRAVRFDKLAIDLWIKRKIDENHDKILQLPDELC